jgi:hypothetical protein
MIQHLFFELQYPHQKLEASPRTPIQKQVPMMRFTVLVNILALTKQGKDLKLVSTSPYL